MPFQAVLQLICYLLSRTLRFRVELSRVGISPTVQPCLFKAHTTRPPSALRAAALGCKNYLFAHSDAGGERAANLYTLIGPAKLNRINPEAYVRHVLERDELLPWNVDLETA